MSNNFSFSSSKEILATMDNCTKCGICYSFCPVANVTKEFPGPKYTGPQTQRFRFIEDLVDWLKIKITFWKKENYLNDYEWVEQKKTDRKRRHYS